MAEYSKEKLYFLKLPKDFFKKNYIKVLKGMPNGHEYALLLLELMCESVGWGGYLRFSQTLPYTPEMVSSLTDTNIDIVRNAFVAYEGLGLAKRTEDSSIYFPLVGDMTMNTTIGAARKQVQRQGGQEVDKCPPDTRDKILDIKSLEIKQDLARYKQPALLQILLDFGFLKTDELTDSQFDDFLDQCVANYDLVNVKIKERYVLKTISHMVDTGRTDKSEKPIFRWQVSKDQMPENRYRWFITAMSNNLKKEEKDDGALGEWEKDDG